MKLPSALKFLVTDKMLVAQWINSRSDEAASQLYERYAHRIFGFVFSQFSNTELAEEAIQYCFMVFAKNPLVFYEAKDFRTYIFTVAHNYCIKKIDEKKNEQDIFEDVGEEKIFEITDSRVDILQIILSKEVTEIIKEFIDREIKKNHKKICYLYFCERLEPKEIAEILNISVNTVKDIIKKYKLMILQHVSNIEKYGKKYGEQREI